MLDCHIYVMVVYVLTGRAERVDTQTPLTLRYAEPRGRTGRGVPARRRSRVSRGGAVTA